MVYIDAVHYEQDEYGNEYIARMKWTNYLTTQATDECTKRQMIDFISKNPNQGEQAADLLMVNKYLERIGDHATNIAERVIFSLDDKIVKKV